MADVVSPAVRSRMMAGIRGKDTKPEIIIRQGLHALGFRYRLHDRRLPGKPDLVFPARRALIFVHGCFWHRHDCHLFRWPSTREDFWRAKITRNCENDRRHSAALSEAGWRLATVWECSLKGRTRLPHGEPVRLLAGWLHSDQPSIEIAGQEPDGRRADDTAV
ncbi:very short patch repair endonuclease [Qipengyuania sp. SM2507]